MHRTVAVLRAIPLRPPMNVSFSASSFEGVREREHRGKEMRRPRRMPFRLVPAPAPSEALAPSSPEVVSVEPPPAPALELPTEIVIDTSELPMNDAPPRPAQTTRTADERKARERREVRVFIDTRGLTIGHDAIGQYIHVILGYKGSQRTYVQRCVDDLLRRDPGCEYNEMGDRKPSSVLYKEAVDSLKADLVALLRREARWMADRTRQGYGACRLRHRNHIFFVLIDRSDAMGPGKIVSVCTEPHFRQTLRSIPSPHRTVRSRRPRTQRNSWSANDD